MAMTIDIAVATTRIHPGHGMERTLHETDDIARKPTAPGASVSATTRGIWAR
jgi:hypothetical protein